LSARRLLDEEEYRLSLPMLSPAWIFLNALLRNSLTSDHILDYTSIDDIAHDRVLT
jgi:hypothetical protein